LRWKKFYVSQKTVPEKYSHATSADICMALRERGIYGFHKIHECNRELVKELAKEIPSNLMYWKLIKDNESGMKTTGPFSAGKAVVEKGYGLKPEVNESGDGKLIVSNGPEKVDLPVVRGNVNTTGLKSLGFEQLSYDVSRARVAKILATFFSFGITGLKKITLDQNARDLLMVNRMFKQFEIMIGDIEHLIGQFCKEGELPKVATGCDAADVFYSLLHKHRELMAAIIAVLKAQVKCPGGKSYVTVENKKLNFNSPVLSIPTRLLDASCKAEDASFEQALYARDVLRGFRGVDEKESG